MHTLQRHGFYRIPMTAKISSVVCSWSRDFEVSKLRLTAANITIYALSAAVKLKQLKLSTDI